MQVYRYFNLTSGVILAITGVAKVISVFGTQMLLQRYDPLFGLSFRQLLLFAGLVEFVVAFLCLFKSKLKFNVLLIAWLSTSLLTYRITLWAMNWRLPCHCLGNLTDVLHIPPQVADNIMKGVLAYLVICSYATLFWFWRQRKKLISKSMPAQ